MYNNMISIIVLLVSIIALTSSTSPCVLKNQIGCIYTVECSEIVKDIFTPTCTGDPYVTLIINNASQDVLKLSFFTTPGVFDSRVKAIKAEDNYLAIFEAGCFAYFVNSLRVDLPNNNIVTINAKAFKGLISMVYLNLSHNNIELFDANSFWIAENKNSKLEELDLSNNRLKYVNTELGQVPNLRKLNLSNNRLAGVYEHAFKDLKQLTHLYLQNNLLTSFNLSLSILDRLSVVDISNNHLTTLADNEIKRAVFIIDFNVSRNKLTSISDAVFMYNRKLQNLDLSNNKISQIHDDAFENCDLHNLNLENNILSTVNEKAFANLRNINKLDLSRQNLSCIRNNAFYNMEGLLHLNLSINSISAIENSAFLNTRITVLDLSSNQIPNMDFLKNGLTNLTELYINDNNITVIPKHTFENKKELKILNLSKNQIFKIEKYSWTLHNLNYLDLSSNHITVIPFNSLRYLSKIKTLDLSKNKLSRLEDRDFYKCRELKTLRMDDNRIRMFDIERFVFSLITLETLSLVNNPITCKDIAHKLYYENITFQVIRHDDDVDTIKLYLDDNIYDIKCGGFLDSDLESDLVTTDNSNSLQSELQAVRLELSQLKSLLVNLPQTLKGEESKDAENTTLVEPEGTSFTNNVCERSLSDIINLCIPRY